MRNRVFQFLMALAVCIALVPAAAFADKDKHGQGNGKHADHDNDREVRHHDRDRDDDRDHDGDRDGRPPGWSKGKKTGWNGCDVPPGQVKKLGCHPNGVARHHDRDDRIRAKRLPHPAATPTVAKATPPRSVARPRDRRWTLHRKAAAQTQTKGMLNQK